MAMTLTASVERVVLVYNINVCSLCLGFLFFWCKQILPSCVLLQVHLHITNS